MSDMTLKPIKRVPTGIAGLDAILHGGFLQCGTYIIDGAPGARFLNVVKNKIENAEALCTI